MYGTYMPPVLVTGATGNVGRPVVRALLAAGREVRAAVRAPGSPVPDGAEVVAFDFTDPGTWTATFRGVEAVFLVRPPQIANVRRDMAPALRAARAAGVRQVVLLSLQGAERVPVVPHAALERELRGSGMDWTFVRAAFFMQNLSTTHAPDIRDRGEIVVPAGRGRTAFVDVEDVAAVAAAALLDPDGHRHRAWTPTGPDALTYAEVATVLGEVLGRPVRYLRPGAAAYLRHARRTLGMPAGMAMVTTAIYTAARLGLAAGLTGDVATVTGRPPGSVRRFAERERHVWTAGPTGLRPHR
jgi:uncharacterized protein YbjT (DUF2867 family)